MIDNGDKSDRLLSVVEAAAWLGVSKRMMSTITSPAGDLSAVRVGRRVLYRPSTLRAWAADREGAP